MLECNDCGYSTEDIQAGMGHAAMRGHSLSAPANAEGTTPTISISHDEDDDDDY